MALMVIIPQHKYLKIKMDLPRLAKTNAASVIEMEVIDYPEAIQQTSTTTRIVDRNIWENTQQLHLHTKSRVSNRTLDGNIRQNTHQLHIHTKSRDVDRNYYIR